MPHSVQPEASVVQVGKGIRYIGNYAWSLSGNITTSSSTYIEHLAFTSGSGFIVAEFNLIGGTIEANVASGDLVIFKIKFNEVDVANIKVTSNPDTAPTIEQWQVLIPPYTIVNVSVRGNSDDNVTAASLIGRVYGAK